MQQLIAGAAGQLVHYPEGLRPPSSATVRWGTPDTAMQPEGEGVSATLDTVSTTLTAAAAAGARSISVASATGIKVGRRYLLTVASAVLSLQVERISGATLWLSSPLLDPAPQGAPFAGYAALVSVPSESLVTVGQGLARWALTFSDGSKAQASEAFEVVTDGPGVPMHPDELQRLWPAVAQYRYRSDADLRAAIEGAVSLYIVPALEAKGLRQEWVKSWAPLKPAIVEACKLQALEADTTVTTDRLQYHRAALATALERALASAALWVSTQTSDTPAPTPLKESARVYFSR